MAGSQNELSNMEVEMSKLDIEDEDAALQLQQDASSPHNSAEGSVGSQPGSNNNPPSNNRSSNQESQVRSDEMSVETEKLPEINMDLPLTKVVGHAHEGTGTSISSQIQKIIAKELIAPSRKGKVDLQSVPMKEYLENTVIPIVHQGLIAVARERPESPIEYLAAFFLKHKDKYVQEATQSNMFHVPEEVAQTLKKNSTQITAPTPVP